MGIPTLVAGWLAGWLGRTQAASGLEAHVIYICVCVYMYVYRVPSVYEALTRTVIVSMLFYSWRNQPIPINTRSR